MSCLIYGFAKAVDSFAISPAGGGVNRIISAANYGKFASFRSLDIFYHIFAFLAIFFRKNQKIIYFLYYMWYNVREALAERIAKGKAKVEVALGAVPARVRDRRSETDKEGDIMRIMSLLLELSGEMIHMILINASQVGAWIHFFRGRITKRRK